MFAVRSVPRRAGFTLVELLTVVGIISLLIGILLPSLSRARDQARRVKVAGTLSSIEKGLEMFHNDFGDYPDSGERDDPVTDYAGATKQDELFGAHWLARAMLGHDLQGVDAAGLVLRNEYEIKVDPPGSGNITVVPAGTGSGMRMADVAGKDRKGLYVEGNIVMRDTDARLKPGGDYQPTGRPILFDAYQQPILYYRAHSRSRRPFSVHGEGAEQVGIYNQWDNGGITGGTSPDGGQPVRGWDFAGTGLRHGLGFFGGDGTSVGLTAANVEQAPPSANPAYAGKSFANYLHDANAGNMGLVVRPQNAERYVLVSAGRDGLYGTDDDVNNLSSGR